MSIGTRYGTIILESVEPGKVYNITEMRNLPYLVVNRGTNKGNVRISVLPPQKPKEGYEPIADPNWLSVRPAEFELEGGGRMPASLILNIPADEDFAGRHYHALIRVENTTGGFFGAAVVNDFFFSVGTPGPEAVERAKAQQLLAELNYDLSPESLFLDITAGQKTDILKETGKSLQLVNRGRQDLELVVESTANTPRFPSYEGYQFTPSEEYLWAEPADIEIKSYQVKDINLFADIPEEHSGKRIMFVIAVYPEGMESVKMYSRVFVNVK